ncbi:MAG: hypothetical protein WAK82_08280, partial [Streptosporangiaceae bacterium]
LKGLPEQILVVPLPGHTRGHCGVAVQGDAGWLLDAGDAYFDARQVHQPVPQVGLHVGLFERVVTTDNRLRLYNQGRLRRFTAAHPEVTVFAAHDPGGFPPTKPRHAERAGVFSYSAASGVSPQRGRPSRAECTSAPSMYETEGAKMRSCCPIPAFTRCPQKAGSYPHVTAVIHCLIHTLLTLTRSNSENTVTWSP